ncbi:MAG: DUF1552 domain-containing protein [Myxococcota bacterium]
MRRPGKAPARSAGGGRRAFLRGLAGASILLPTLSSLRPARGQEGGAGNVIYVTQPHGTFGEAFFPRDEGTSKFAWPDPEWNRRERLRHAFSGDTAMVKEAPDLATPILTPLQPHAPRTTLLENVSNMSGGRTSEGHDQFAGILSGHQIKREEQKGSPGPSIDVVLGGIIGAGSRLPSTQLALHQKSGGPFYSFTSWNDALSIAPGEEVPQRFYERVFGGAATDPDGIERLARERRSILDGALGQAEALQQRLGNEDRRRLGLYLDAVREVEQRLQAPAALSCDAPAAPGELPGEAGTPNGMERRAEVMVDLLALAVACGATKVANLQIASEGNRMRFSFLGNDSHVWHQGLDHCKGHEDNAVERLQTLIELERWVVGLIVRLADRLAELDALADTAIVWMHNMGSGCYHNNDCAPIVIVGDLGGRLRTGRHVRYEFANKRDVRIKRQNIDLHYTIAQALGVDIGEFGDRDLYQGVLDEVLV